MAPPLIPAEANTLRILAFGDSLTEGYTDFGTVFHPYGTALAAHLKELLPPETAITVDVEGVSGDRVLSSLAGRFETRLRRALAAPDYAYDIVILLGGTNDLAYTRDMADVTTLFDDGLLPLYEFVQDTTSARLVLLTVPERMVDHGTSALSRGAVAKRVRLNEMIEQWAAKQPDVVHVWDFAREVPFIEPTLKGDDSECNWSIDGLHMSARGYDVVGEKLAHVVFGLISPPS